ncbi:DUF3152 domain-containing protein [Streptomyces monticola]|uniref:DUF3152 domain-containing protein n=1 Tax=Streptomyces monticola TaxID=2666263 RepID=UPI003AA95503
MPVAPQSAPAPGPGSGRRRRGSSAPAEGAPSRAHSGAPAAAPGARPHPEHREPGGGWGRISGAGPSAAAGARSFDTGAQPRVTGGQPRITGAQPRVPGPRREYVDAFESFDGAGAFGGTDDHDDDVFAAGAPPRRPDDPYGDVTAWDSGADDDEAPHPAEQTEPAARGKGGRGGRGRTFTGIAAAAVTTVLAVVVAGQVADGPRGDAQARAADADGEVREQADSASRSAERPAKGRSAPLTYDQKMGEKYPLAADAKASGEFEAIAGFDKAPGRGQKFRYRVDVEKGLGLDGQLFAQAVQKTLNDERSWAHGGGRTFERISSGKPDFVITLASPGTTGVWCAKSGLDTTQDNVSCDSAATERVMINAFRWAQGAETYGDAIHPYRQMLINHEVGHRLGFNHVMCSKDGALAPVMQQQTKFLEHDGIKCRPNAWAFPGN